MKRSRGCRRWPVQGRRAFLWGVAWFVVLQLGLTALMETRLPHLRDPYYPFKVDRLRRRVTEAASAGPAPRVAVMLGSSRTADGLCGIAAAEELGRELGRPVILYNFGVPGTGPIFGLVHLERLLADGVRPDLVLVEVVPVYLHAAGGAYLQALPAERFGLRDLAALERNRIPVGQLGRYSWMCWAAPWYAHRLEVLAVTLPTFKPGFLGISSARKDDPSGWRPSRLAPTPEELRKAKEAALGHFGPLLADYWLGNAFCAATARTLARCREEKIPAALVIMPEGKAFQKLYPPGAWEQVEAFAARLGAEHGAPVIDARDWVPEEGFIDAHHLLPAGARQFTLRLAREGVLPRLRAASPPCR